MNFTKKKTVIDSCVSNVIKKFLQVNKRNIMVKTDKLNKTSLPPTENVPFISKSKVNLEIY